MNKKTQQWIAFVFGVTFVVVLLLIAVFFPTPTQFQYTVFRIVLALATAGVAAMIPGFLSIELGVLGAIIRAGGALGVFVIVYFFSPAQIVSTPPNEYKTSVNIRNFDLLDKFTDSPEIISSGSFEASVWPEQRDKLTSILVEKLRTTTYPEIKFTISSDQLQTSQHVVLWMPGAGVQGLGSLRPITEIKPDSPLDLTKLFSRGYPGMYFISSDHAELRFRCANRLFETNQLSVQKTNDGYSFRADGQSVTEITITPRLKVLLLDSFTGQGDSNAEGFAADLKATFESAISDEESLSLASFSLQQLESVRSELIKWPFEKSNKGHLIGKYSVDVILSSTVIATPK
ncbi:MAG: hypothetical protein GY801_36020 [bacterium]|nr:hypothetical protein [bacterium]